MSGSRGLAFAVVLLHSLLLLHGEEPDPLDQWTLVGSPGLVLRGIAHLPGQFVGVGFSTNVVLSTNGSDWSQVPVGLSDPYTALLAVTAGAEQFVAVGWKGIILTSPDAVHWTKRREQAPEELWAVTYGGNRFVAVGFRADGVSRAVAAVSEDGIEWQSATIDIATTPRNVAYGNGRYVAAGVPVSLWSENGLDWHPIDSVLGHGVAYGNGQFITTLTTRGHRSTNGLSWSPVELPVLVSGNQSYYMARFANGTFLLGGYCNDCPPAEGQALVAASSDGLNWTPRLLGANRYVGTIRDAVFVDGRFYLADQTGKIWRSGKSLPEAEPVLSGMELRESGVTISATVVAGYRYVLECTDRLGPAAWAPCLAPFFALTDRLELTDGRPVSQARYYRLREGVAGP